MSDQLDLLAPPPFPEWARHLTGVRAVRVAQGVHPLGGARLKGGPETCAGCAHKVRRVSQGVVYYRCAVVHSAPGLDGDLRPGWAACERYEEAAP